MAHWNPQRTPWYELKRGGITADAVLRHFDIIAPPIPVISIAQRMEVPVYLQSDIDYSGAVSSDVATGEAFIVVNAHEAEVRRRFTIAHELGHLLLHRSGVAFRDTTYAHGNAAEREANAFAADLLMPLWLLDPAASAYGFDAERLARLFLVSRQAMEYRLPRLIGKPQTSYWGE